MDAPLHPYGKIPSPVPRLMASEGGGMKLEFLSAKEPKIVRTTLYNDQEFSTWELELLHTPVMQRLYNLKQLGFADRVFPDAVHSRFNHILGVAEMAERMAGRVVRWLRKNKSATFEYVRETPDSPRAAWPLETLTGEELAQHAEGHIPVIRLIALLHDLTHAAYGHTLEDEVCVFPEKHDERPRQTRFFNALVGQLLYLWVLELHVRPPDPDVLDSLAHLEVSKADALKWAEEVHSHLNKDEAQQLREHLRSLEAALSLLTYLEFLHEEGQQETCPSQQNLLVSDILRTLEPGQPSADVVVHRDALFLDIVGNTVCADLLDYARRDAHNAGLRVQFDERLIRYLCSVSVSGDLSPTGRPCIRLALQFFTDKMRYDVLSEMSGVLKARYLINERVLFHPTKCAAGAMLGTALQLLGVDRLPEWMQILGDQEFVRLLTTLASRMEAELKVGSDAELAPTAPGDRLGAFVGPCVREVLTQCEGANGRQHALERVRGARTLLWRLVSRRYPKLVYRLRCAVHLNASANAETVAKEYADPKNRFTLERTVEERCNLPPGTLVVHCPKRKTSMKVAQALVVGADLSRVAHLRDVDKVTPESLGPYHSEIRAVEDMYKAIWQFHAFLDWSQFEKRAIVEKALQEEVGFGNDDLLSKSATGRILEESAYDLLAGPLIGEYPANRLPLLVRRIDEAGTVRRRHGRNESLIERVRRIIREVEAEQVHSKGHQASMFKSE